MVPLFLILIPLAGGLAGFFIKNSNNAKLWSLLASVVTLLVSVTGLLLNKDNTHLFLNVEWLSSLNSRFSVGLDGMGQLLCFLTAIGFPVIFIATWREDYKNAGNFHALMLLSQAGLVGGIVF